MLLRMITCSNQLRTGDDVRELANCNALSVLDLSHNLLEEPEVTKYYRVSALIKQAKMAKHGRLVNIPKWSKGVQKGLKW